MIYILKSSSISLCIEYFSDKINKCGWFVRPHIPSWILSQNTYMGGGQKTINGSWLSPWIIWVPGIQFKLSSTLAHWATLPTMKLFFSLSFCEWYIACVYVRLHICGCAHSKVFSLHAKCLKQCRTITTWLTSKQ